MDTTQRLDASESAFFERQLEQIAEETLSELTAAMQSRELIPTEPGVSPDITTYTYRLFEHFGEAKLIDAGGADDIPLVGISGREQSSTVKIPAAGFAHSIFEIRNAARVGVSLSNLGALGARATVERKVDDLLALGSALHGVSGLLTLSNTQTETPVTKTGGGTTWANATAAEIARDIARCVMKIKAAVKRAGGPMFDRFVVVIPEEQYHDIAMRPWGVDSDKTVLNWVLSNSAFIESIRPWHHASGAGADGTDRMVVYPRNRLIASAVVAQEWTMEPPQHQNFRMVTNTYAKTAGVISRFPFGICYMDGI